VIICAVLATLSGCSAPSSLRKAAEAAPLRVRRSSREADRNVAATRRMNINGHKTATESLAWYKHRCMPKKRTFDCYTFVAAAALERGEPFPVSCSCGGVVTVMPPFQEKSVICPVCESAIGIHVIEGDPGYIIGRNPKGGPMLIPVQGSSAKPLEAMTEKEQQQILKNVEAEIAKHTKQSGNPE
jgi:hypothetical protein